MICNQSEQRRFRKKHAFRVLSTSLGQLDSNQRVQESKSCALPLGDGPMYHYMSSAQ